ncbi:MAG: RNA methyltransferase [Saprospiraceae bacterium]|jgi:TrmH family RNA methyltransferase|nr:RNA methyltransferase [Saprospiraceae bacterium]MBK6481417.1 RNA methyltransferase [Saprospiraceae bacterium]MBK6815889.1 RNA methyltransferase [Saprospiraceae bacterium]MBK7370639.1 RNA methyltransferase [Saprospiraceae bacterium]MBK7438798.1 RNA methyltransferase [Saprospiraceae bacterium]
MLKAGFDKIYTIYVSEEILNEHINLLTKVKDKLVLIGTKDFEQISNLESIPDIILIGHISAKPSPDPSLLHSGIHLYLDQIQDPGNMGTILRTAEWFNVKSIGISEGCADIYHPKVIQSSMGSFIRVHTWYGELSMPNLIPGIPIIGADLSGTSLYTVKLPAHGVLVIGNEGQGISAPIRALITSSIKIPAYSTNIESLNAANATAIVLSEWRRQLRG